MQHVAGSGDTSAQKSLDAREVVASELLLDLAIVNEEDRWHVPCGELWLTESVKVTECKPRLSVKLRAREG